MRATNRIGARAFAVGLVAAAWVAACDRRGPTGSPAPTPSSQRAAPASGPAPVDIAPGQSIEGRLTDGGRQVYRLRLQAGVHVELGVEPRALDLRVRVMAPDGRVLLDAARPSALYGLEILHVVCDGGGEYRLEPSSASKSSGTYAIRVGRPATATASDRRLGAATLELVTADALFRRGTHAEVERAILLYSHVVALWRGLRRAEEVARTLGRLGDAWMRLGEVARAHACYREGLQEAGQSATTRAWLLGEYGVTCRQLGRPAEAEAAYRQALALADRHELLLAQADVLDDLGVLAFHRGLADAAVEYHERSRAVAERAGDPRRAAAALHGMGAAYTLLGRPADALDVLARALELRRTFGDVREQASTLREVGWAHHWRAALDAPIAEADRAADRNEALDAYAEALKLLHGTGDARSIAGVLDRRATTLLALGRAEDALADYREALGLVQGVGDGTSVAHSLANVAEALAAAGQLDAARAKFTEAVSRLHEAGDPNAEAAAQLGLARVERRLRRLGPALAAGERALELIESVRQAAVSRASRTQYLSARQKHYEFLTGLLLERDAQEPGRGFAERAFDVCERARARALLDELDAVRTTPQPRFEARRRELRDRLNAEAELLAEMDASRAPGERVAAERKLTELILALENLERQAQPVASTSPPLDLAEIRRLVLDDHTQLLLYALGAERSYLFRVTTRELEVQPLPPRQAIETLARRVQKLLGNREVTAVPQAAVAAGELADVVIGPVAGRLAADRLVVVADGTLQYVPFTVLPVRAASRTAPGIWGPPGRVPLVVDHEVVHVPSASVLARLRRSVARRAAAHKGLAVLGDPVYERSDARVQRGVVPPATPAASPTTGNGDLERSAQDFGVTRFERLRWSREEAETIAKLAGPLSFKALDFDATRDLVLSGALRDFGIIHFAAHALLNSEHPQLSGVVLSRVDAQGRPRDGFLRAEEVYDLELTADLVVLSGCRTALGRDVRGEGLVGLPQSFLHAGAARVVVSLWSVRDRATAELMERFHRSLHQGLSPAAALRQAQVSMWREPTWSAPYNWGAFVLEGDF